MQQCAEGDPVVVVDEESEEEEEKEKEDEIQDHTEEAEPRFSDVIPASAYTTQVNEDGSVTSYLTQTWDLYAGPVQQVPVHVDINPQIILQQLQSRALVAARYCDGRGRPTQRYPANPNGSADAVAALCSADGRHLCVMPHPDRAFLRWQWPDYPRSWPTHAENEKKPNVSPWIRMFENAYEWCTSGSDAENDSAQ